MKKLSLVCAMALAAANGAVAEPALSLTIYNQNFAVVRDTVPLDLKAGLNHAQFADTTAQVETDSVILRDPSGKVPLQILEQSYRNDPVSQGMLLSLNEGKTIEFQSDTGNGQKKTVQGKVIRSGYQGQGGAAGQPIIEVDGKLQFSLPGEPVFPALADDTVLKPTLAWAINVPQAAKLDAELAYITGGLTWKADYNILGAEKGDIVDITGWVTFENQSGKTFNDTRVRLMAGDVSKIQRRDRAPLILGKAEVMGASAESPAVTGKAFDEYHLYTLENRVTLRDRETKQVEFIRAPGVQAKKVYIYDGLALYGLAVMPMENRRNNEGLGTQSDTKVAVMREIKNSEANHLGLPLPKGRVRFYKQDADGTPEFTGENEIDHTPKDETLRIFTGNAFDLTGERRRTNFVRNDREHFVDETVEITLRNHKKEPVEIKVIEHLFRWTTWEIVKPSEPFTKTAAQVIEFRVQVKPDEEKKLSYTAHYTW